MVVHKDLFNSDRIGKYLQLSEKIVLATYMKVGYDGRKNLRYNNIGQTIINKNNGKRKTCAIPLYCVIDRHISL